MIALGGEAGSAELREWATRELPGYGPDDELPEYRWIVTSIHADMAYRTTLLTGQPIIPKAHSQRVSGRHQRRNPSAHEHHRERGVCPPISAWRATGVVATACRGSGAGDERIPARREAPEAAVYASGSSVTPWGSGTGADHADLAPLVNGEPSFTEAIDKHTDPNPIYLGGADAQNFAVPATACRFGVPLVTSPRADRPETPGPNPPAHLFGRGQPQPLLGALLPSPVSQRPRAVSELFGYTKPPTTLADLGARTRTPSAPTGPCGPVSPRAP